MTLPYPPNTARAAWTDAQIKDLAYAVDRRLGPALKVSVLAAFEGTTDGNGSFYLTFPGLGQVAGALVLPDGTKRLAGAITAMPPVPPGTIGRAVPPQPVFLAVADLGAGGRVTVKCYTTPWDNGVWNGQTQQVGAQLLTAGQTIKVHGLAWGAAA